MKFLADDELKSWCKNGVLPDNVIILDVREPDEYLEEHIPASRNVPLAKLAKTDFSSDQHKTVIVHCRSGNRTRMAKDLIQGLDFKEIYCLPDGINQWKRCGLPLICAKDEPMGLARQLQIIAGVSIIAGVAGAFFISKYFLMLSGIVGAGLMLSGIFHASVWQQGCPTCRGLK